MNMDLGSHPCACGLAVRPRRPFGMTKSTAEAPSSGTGLHAQGAYGLSADTASPRLRRCGPFLIQGAHAVRVSKGGQHTWCWFPSFETPRFAWLLRMRFSAYDDSNCAGKTLESFRRKLNRKGFP